MSSQNYPGLYEASDNENTYGSYPNPALTQQLVIQKPSQNTFAPALYNPVPYSSPCSRPEGRRLIRDARIPSACYRTFPCEYCGQPSV